VTQTWVTAMRTFALATLSPSDHGDPSPSPQIDVLGVPSDLTSIQLCSRDKESPGSPYCSAILTRPPRNAHLHSEEAHTGIPFVSLRLTKIIIIIIIVTSCGQS